MIRRLWLSLCGSVALLVGLLSSAAGAQAAGQLLSAGSTGISGTQFFAVTGQGDGRIVAAGESGGAQLIVARFNASGSLDTSFGSGGIAYGPSLSTGTVGRGVAVDSSGNILVAGQLTNGFANSGMLLERFTAAGRLDGRFGAGAGAGGVATALGANCGAAFSIALQGNGDIVLGGSGCPTSGKSVTALARFTPGGALDPSFGGGGTVLQDLGDFSVAYGVAVDADGKIVIAGSQRPGGQVPNGIAARFNSNGSLDFFFQQYPANGSGSIEFRGVALQGTDIALAGATPNSSGSSAIVVRLNGAGQRDPSFNAGNPVYLAATAPSLTQPPAAPYPGAYGVAVSGGDIIAGGFILNTAQLDEPALWALGPSGSLDKSFGSGGVVFSSVAPDSGELGALTVSSADGSILAAGSSSPVNGFPTGLVARYGGSPALPPPPPPPPPPVAVLPPPPP
ncbi:MAG: hypothetical protein M3Y41_22260, partial [Pseudomonadota bacterium]|nr:hypothetical protein [Pseudomonadota bacterium]